MRLCYATFLVLAEVPSGSERPTCLRFVMDKLEERNSENEE